MKSSEHETRYDFDGSHATPMLLSGDHANAELVAKQNELGKKFEALAHEELDDYAGSEVATFVAVAIRRRMSQREGQNSQSYTSRINRLPNLFLPGHSPVTVFKSVASAKIGAGMPTQMHIARKAHRMGSSEDANLTEIGTARQHLREPMYEAVQKLAGHAIDFGEATMYRTAFLGTDHNDENTVAPRVLRVGAKHGLSTLEDGAQLKSRNTFIIDVRDPRQFDPDLIRHFDKVHAAGGYVPDIPEFKKIVRDVTSGDIDPRLVLAANRTIYEVHPPTIERIKASLQAKQERRYGRKHSAFERPTNDIERYPIGDPRRSALEMYGTE